MKPLAVLLGVFVFFSGSAVAGSVAAGAQRAGNQHLADTIGLSGIAAALVIGIVATVLLWRNA